MVAEFVARWLGLRPTKAIVEAAANALLQAPLDGTDPDGDHAVVRRLRAATKTQRRAWRPIGETRIRHAPVDSLDRPLRAVGEDELLTLADTVGACDPPVDTGPDGPTRVSPEYWPGCAPPSSASPSPTSSPTRSSPGAGRRRGAASRSSSASGSAASCCAKAGC